MLKQMRNLVILRNKTEIYDVPRIIRDNEVKDVVGTILDPDFEKNGALLDLPEGITTLQGIDRNRLYTKVYIPPCPHSRQEGFIVIDDIAMKVNNLLRLFKIHKAGNADSLKKIGTSFKRFQTAILGKITGKDGILSRDVLGTRIKGSGRAVLVPRTGHPNIVALPQQMMAKMGLMENDQVIVGRDPVIWDGSVEVFRATAWDKDTIGVNPVWFKQMGADSDGDTVFVIKLPSDIDCNLESYLYTKRRDLSNKSQLMVPVDYVGKSSVAPCDIINNTENIKTFESLTGKVVNKECLMLIEGIPQQEINNYRLLLNEVMLIQKVYMGPTGSVANKIKLMSSHHDFLIKSANYVSERIQQSLFDHKSAVSTSGDNRDIFDLLDLMNMRGKYATLNESIRVNHIEALNRIKEHGLEIEKSAPIITWLYTAVHIYDICKEVFYKLEHSNNRDKLLELNNLIESMCLPDNAIDQVKSTKIFLSILSIINEVTPHKKAKFNEEYINNKKRSLSELLSNPFYTLVNETTKKSDTLFECLDHINYLIKYPERSVTITDQLFVAALGDINVNNGIDRADDSTSGVLSSNYESDGEKRIQYIPDID